MFPPLNKVWSYQYVCRCDCRYVDRTSLRLQDRINEHNPKSIRNNQKPTKILPKRNCKEKINTTKHLQCVSVIGLHLLLNKQCANNYNNQQFSILTRARIVCHLSALEATNNKTLKPILFRQKDFVYSPSFDTTSISINTILPLFYRFLCILLTVSYIALNQSAASMTSINHDIHILAFYSNDDSWKVLDENVRIFNSLYQGYSN